MGGGDTGSDCIGTSIRQGALSVTQLEIMPSPPDKSRTSCSTWPDWPLKLRTSSSHEEGAERDFAVMTQRFSATNGAVGSCIACASDADVASRRPGSEFDLQADLVLLAMGFVSPVQRRPARRARRGARRARQCGGQHRATTRLGRQGVRLRRHAPWAVARGLGDPRGAAGGALRRSGARRRNGTAALALNQFPARQAKSSARPAWRSAGRSPRTRRATADARLAAAERPVGRTRRRGQRQDRPDRRPLGQPGDQRHRVAWRLGSRHLVDDALDLGLAGSSRQRRGQLGIRRLSTRRPASPPGCASPRHRRDRRP